MAMLSTSASKTLPAKAVRFGFYEWVLLPLFIVAATQIEFGGDDKLGGIAVMFRLIAAMAFLVALAMKNGLPISLGQIFVIIQLCLYFLAVNMMNMTYFAVMGTVFIVWGMTIGGGVGKSWARLIDFYIRGYLTFHLIGFVLAIIIYLVAGQIIDLHNIVFPFSFSRAGVMMDQVRLSGFQIEPGNYSNSAYLFVVLRALLRRRIFNRFDLVIILSTLATLAAWAVIGCGVYLVALLIEFLRYNENVSTGVRLTVLYTTGAVVLIAFPVLVGLFWDNDFTQKMAERFSGAEGKGSADLKLEAFVAWQQQFGWRMLFGRPLPDSFCPTCESPQDIGTLINMVYYFGIIPTLMLLLVVLAKLLKYWNLTYVVLFAPFAVTKFYFYDPVMWLLFGIILFGGSAVSRNGGDMRMRVDMAASRWAHGRG
jgi:hypothetical protein